ncbi:MAG: LysR family transcriptional regulator [Myxococcales bacterium]|nr:LysR family transcriptional regulator [Myxococcales bacterium]MCB9712461.1 LysR family transcriptional regulator [Myxococcales bacterium]
MADPFDGILPFVHTARARSFRVAAEQLGVTPAAVSKAIKRLEGELGVALLHRTTRRVSLSDEGARFLAHCEGALAHVQAGRDELEAARRVPRGELTVTLSHVLGPFLLARLPRFTARYPGLRLDLRLTDRRSRLVDDRIDVALRVGPLPDSTMVARKLLSPRWATVAAPDYLARHGTPDRPAALSGHACLRFRSPRGKAVPWTFLDDAGQPAAIEVPGRVDLDQGQLLVEAALAGLGVAQVFDFMAHEPIREGRLVEVLHPFAAPGPEVFALVLPQQAKAPKVRAFLDFATEALGTGR